MVRKTLTRAMFVVIGLIGVGYIGGNYGIDLASQRFLALCPRYEKQLGLRLIDPKYERVRFASFNSIAWDGVESYLQLTDHNGLNRSRKFNFRIRSLELSVLDLSFERFALEGKGIFVQPIEKRAEGGDRYEVSAAGDLAAEGFVGDCLRLRFQLDPRNLLAGAKRLARNLSSLAKTGKTTAHIELSGEVEFVEGNSRHAAKIHTIREHEQTIVVVDKDDLRKFANDSIGGLTPAEIDLLSHHLLQATPLLRLKEYAEKASREAHLRDGTVPEDAYRHVLWSYLVARDFGPELAKEVTDAHEIGRTGNSYAESKMDEHNNEVGRIYAAKGVPESQILKYTRTDPRVVRSVDELHLKRNLLR